LSDVLLECLYFAFKGVFKRSAVGNEHSLRHVGFNALKRFAHMVYIIMVACGECFMVYCCHQLNLGVVMTIPNNTRTFLPRLVVILLLVCGYIGRYRITILKYLPPDSEALLDAVEVACEALRVVAEAQLPADS